MQAPSPLRTLAAFLYDSFIAFAIIMIGTYALLPLTHGQAVHSGNHWYQLYLFCLLFAYWGGFWFWRGQTVGMLAWKIKVVNLEGQKIKFWQALIRFCFGFGLFIFGWLFAFFNKDRRGLYDFLARTRLIKFTPAS